MEELKRKLRQHMQLVWELSALDEEVLSSDDQALAEIMQMHSDYYDLWNRLADVTDDELAQMETNPILHILVHQIVENQLINQTPPETAETLDQLMQQGLSRHEAVHQIGAVLMEDMSDMVQSNRSFDDQRYVQSLRRLIRPRRRRRRRR
jgi:uncharacterized protein YoaH (UPF0181 family)